ncbi:UNVERIFIED_CONTAM: hypothetical protein GTU68_041496 [Idotea baltica]|nr:hypothetical protein [Idotea baltica]
MIIGVVGGGQLCRMMAESIKNKNLPHEIIALDPTENCPASEFIKEQILGDFKDENKIRELASKVDVLTFEIELANSKVLREIEESGKIVAPSPESLYTIQDKFRQKTFLRENNIPVGDFKSVSTKKEIENTLEDFGYPALLKATQDSYDGRGNLVIKSKEDIDKGLDLFKDRSIMLEKFIDFSLEISVMAFRNQNGDIGTYPVSENIHVDNILMTAIFPARISDELKLKAKSIAEDIMKIFKGSGVFGIEMFVDKDENILVNEIAPRVHNSGHHTTEACKTSQFEQHIRAITDMELGDTELKNNAIMCNILGTEDINNYKVSLKEDLPDNAFLHMYNKHEVKEKRKMGHLTVVTDSIDEANKIKAMIKLEAK